MGGFLSVPTVVRSPVVKKSTAAYLWKSFESNTPPSLLAVTLKPCFSPREVTACSTMLSLPSTRLTTSCSQPDDFVETSTDFLPAANNQFGKVILPAATHPVCTNWRRLKMVFINSRV